MPEKQTEIKELGEFQLIDKLTEGFSLQHDSSILGIGDDAAVIDAGDHYQLVTTDLLLEGVHFDLTYCPLQHLGYKAVVTGLSDIAAMNGIPQQIVVGLGVSNRFSLETLQAVYEGIRAACQHYKVDLVGGDTTASASGLVLSVTAVGQVAKDQVCRRQGAQPHDILCVTGDLGAAYLGLQVLTREKKVLAADEAMQPDLTTHEYLLQRQLRPEARTGIVHELHDQGLVPTAMIDITDGLASELFQLRKASKVGFRVYEDKLPIDAQTHDTATSLNLNPTMCAMNGGEDYELLFTIRPQDIKKVEKHPDISLIGYTTKDLHVQLVTAAGAAIPLQAQGWEQGGSA